MMIMIDRILVPLDGSAVSESILPTVQAFAHVTGAAVMLFQVVEPMERLVEGPDPAKLVAAALRAAEPRAEAAAPTVADLERQAGERAHAYLVEIAEQLQRQGTDVHIGIGQGVAADAIMAMAGDYDLVAMATHGRGGVGRWVYGSVADKVLRGAAVPVLLIRARPDSPAWSVPPRRILVPLDGSELAERALPLATALAERAGAEALLIQSVSWAAMAMAAPFGSGYGIGMADLLEQAQGDATAYLDDIARRLSERGLAVRTDVRLEPAADAILDMAGEQQADLIVMSTHGRGGLGRWVYGSVADRVLRGAAIPVLLVRAGQVALNWQPVSPDGNVHITPRDGGWSVREDGRPGDADRFASKDAAVAGALRLAGQRGGAVVIHGHDDDVLGGLPADLTAPIETAGAAGHGAAMGSSSAPDQTIGTAQTRERPADTG
jgi:nucleotide-binding universal stress UspA family protein